MKVLTIKKIKLVLILLSCVVFNLEINDGTNNVDYYNQSYNKEKAGITDPKKVLEIQPCELFSL